jgi:hypothetical protein
MRRGEKGGGGQSDVQVARAVQLTLWGRRGNEDNMRSHQVFLCVSAGV